MTASDLPSPVWIAGCGYLGSALAHSLLDRGCEVLGLTRSAESTPALDIPLATADLSQIDSLRRVSNAHPCPAVIVHCASSGRGGAEAYEAVYYQGANHLLTVFPEAVLLFTSSTSVYGQTQGETVTEESPAEPDRETGRILRRTEDLVLANRGVVVRLAGIYGPGRSVLLKRMFEGTAVIETGTSRFLNQIHRDDAVSALITLIEQEDSAHGTIFNVVDGHPLTQRGCMENLASHLEVPLPPEAPPDPNRKRGWTHKRILPLRLQELGWNPRYPSFLDAVQQDARLVPSIRDQIPG